MVRVSFEFLFILLRMLVDFMNDISNSFTSLLHFINASHHFLQQYVFYKIFLNKLHNSLMLFLSQLHLSFIILLLGHIDIDLMNSSLPTLFLKESLINTLNNIVSLSMPFFKFSLCFQHSFLVLQLFFNHLSSHFTLKLGFL
jgi:hypothetical protein